MASGSAGGTGWTLSKWTGQFKCASMKIYFYIRSDVTIKSITRKLYEWHSLLIPPVRFDDDGWIWNNIRTARALLQTLRQTFTPGPRESDRGRAVRINLSSRPHDFSLPAETVRISDGLFFSFYFDYTIGNTRSVVQQEYVKKSMLTMLIVNKKPPR